MRSLGIIFRKESHYKEDVLPELNEGSMRLWWQLRQKIRSPVDLYLARYVRWQVTINCRKKVRLENDIYRH
jgi:hypothetical protein